MKTTLLLLLLFFFYTPVFSFILTEESAYDYETSVRKVLKLIKDKDLDIIAVVDHAKAAKVNKMYLPPSIVFIFGNAQLSTSFLQDNPLWSIYLPFEIAIYNDVKGKTWIAVPDLAQREKNVPLSKDQDRKITVMKNIIKNILYIE